MKQHYFTGYPEGANGYNITALYIHSSMFRYKVLYQRIYTPIEVKVTPPPCRHYGAFCPSKPEAVRKTTPEFLSAVLRKKVFVFTVLY